MSPRPNVLRTIALTASAAAALSLAYGLFPAYAGCVAVMSQSYVDSLNRASHSNSYKTNNPLPANITTEQQCQDYLKTFWNYKNDSGYQKTRCECNGSSGGGGGGGISIPSGATPGQALALGILGAALNSAMAQPAGPSAEEIARKQAQEEEARRRAEEEARRQAEEAARLAAIEKARRLAIAGQMKGADGQPVVTASSGGRTAGWKSLDLDMAAPTAASAVTPGGGGNAGAMSTFERLRCARAFSAAAAQYTSLSGRDAAEKERFFSQQAENALAGRPLDAECPPSGGMPAVPMPTGIEIVYPGEGTLPELKEKARTDLASLSAVNLKKSELSGRRANVEAKKKELSEKMSTPAEPVPEGAAVPNPDALKAEAEALLRESEKELAEIARDEITLADERKRLNDNLTRYQSKMTALETGNPAK